MDRFPRLFPVAAILLGWFGIISFALGVWWMLGDALP